MPALTSPGTGSPVFSRNSSTAPPRVAADQAVGGGVLDRVQADRRPRPALLVGAQQRAQVEVGEDVAVEGEEALVELVAELRRRRSGSRPAVPQRLGLGHVADPRPRPARPRRSASRSTSGRKPQARTTSSTPCAAEPLDHVGEEGPVDQRQRRLRHRRGQRPQPRPFAADQDDRLHQLSRALAVGGLDRAADALVLEARRRAAPRSRGSCGRRRSAAAPSAPPPRPSRARRTRATR